MPTRMRWETEMNGNSKNRYKSSESRKWSKLSISSMQRMLEGIRGLEGLILEVVPLVLDGEIVENPLLDIF